MLTNQLVEKFNISPSSPSPPSLFIILSVLCHHFPSVVFYKSGFSQESRSSRCCVLGTEHTAGCRADTGIGRAGGGLLRDPVNRGCRHRPLPATAKRCACSGAAVILRSPREVSPVSHLQQWSRCCTRVPCKVFANFTSAYTWQQSPENNGFLSSNFHVS